MGEKKVRIAIFVPVELRDRIKDISVIHGRTMVGQLRWWANHDSAKRLKDNKKKQ